MDFCGDPCPLDPTVTCTKARGHEGEHVSAAAGLKWDTEDGLPHTEYEPFVRPEHYGGEENPFEAIKVIEHYELNFSRGSALKYILRCGKKDGEDELKELKKAFTYIGFEIRRLEKG